MICELKSFEDRSQRGRLHLKQVLSSAELEDFISVLEPYDATARLFYEKLSPLHLQGSEQLFVGYSEETPVTIAILFKQGETAGIFSLLTKESSRGQGFGTEMMRYLMSFAKKSGVTHVTLSASSDSGYRIYEHLGFKRLGQFECFECRDQA
jgi:ribosomal protein S18 acetylase RimI-like enzyme